MILHLLFFAAAASQPVKWGTLFSRNDYPEQAIQSNEEGGVFVQILINPAGDVDTCTVIQSSGFADLDEQTCSIIRTRGKFSPAKDEDGSSVFSLVGVPVVWALDQAPRVTVNPDFDLMINHGPPGVRFPLKMSVSYLITPAGTATKCQTLDPNLPQELVDVACKVITTTPYNIVRDHNGKPVTALDSVSVRFRVKR